MEISVPAEPYDDCRQICLSIAADLARLAAGTQSKNFPSQGLSLLRGDLIATAALMLEITPTQDAGDLYTIELALYSQVLERISGITGIALLYLELSRTESFHCFAGRLMDLLARLNNFELAAS